jgi:hypothetical protein
MTVLHQHSAHAYLTSVRFDNECLGKVTHCQDRGLDEGVLQSREGLVYGRRPLELDALFEELCQWSNNNTIVLNKFAVIDG